MAVNEPKLTGLLLRTVSPHEYDENRIGRGLLGTLVEVLGLRLWSKDGRICLRGKNLGNYLASDMDSSSPENGSGCKIAAEAAKPNRLWRAATVGMGDIACVEDRITGGFNSRRQRLGTG